MAELPALPLYTDALLADTSHMSAEAFGAYLRILVVMWRHGGRLADDDRELARIAGMPLSRWRHVAVVVRRCLTAAGGQVSQKRLTATLYAVRERRRKLAEAGERGAAARWGEGPEPGTRFRQQLWPKQNQKKVPTRGVSDCDSSPDLWQGHCDRIDESMPTKTKKERESVETQSAPSRRAGAPAAPAERPYGEKKPPAGSLATARHEGALASPPGAEQAAAEGRKPPHLATRAELEASFASRRAHRPP